MSRLTSARLRWKIVAGCLFAVLVIPVPANAGSVVTFFQNGTGQAAQGLEVIFGVPFATIYRFEVLTNPPDAGPVTITTFRTSNSSETGFDLMWGAPGLPAGATVTFEFGPIFGDVALIIEGPFPFFTTESGTQLPAPPVGPGAWNAMYMVSVPEPSSLVLAGTAAVAGLGLWVRRRARR